MDHMKFESAESAKTYAESNRQLGYAHCYVYQFKGEYFLMWHHENRYVDSYMPHGAKIVWHGEIEWGFAPGDWSIKWESRSSNHSAEDLDMLSGALGEDVARYLLNLNKDNE